MKTAIDTSMHTCLLLCLSSVVATAMDLRQTGLPSPDKKYVAYTTPANNDGTGSILFVRSKQARVPATYLMKNDRWIEASWSPNSKFLAVIYGLDGHITDIYVYGLSLTPTDGIKVSLYYHTPNPGTYDTKWSLNGWKSNDTITLTKQVSSELNGVSFRKGITVHIGSKPIVLEADPQSIHFPGG